MYGKGGDIFSENQRKGGNLKSYVRDRGCETNSMDKHEIHQVVGVQVPGLCATRRTMHSRSYSQAWHCLQTAAWFSVCKTQLH